MGEIREFGIVANVVETDRVFRLGAKCWLVGGTGGQGWHKFIWLGASRSGRQVEKWSNTERFGSFRAAWIPEPVRKRCFYFYMDGTREEMEARAKELNEFADNLRATKVNRPERHKIVPGSQPPRHA